MHIQLINSIQHPLSSSMEELYLEAFPKAERKPIETLYTHQDLDYCDVFGITTKEGGPFVGMITTIKGENLIMVEYFAIAPEFRGQGYGSRTLELLLEKYPDTPICLEIEDTQDKRASNYEQRLSRKRFYQANGFNPVNWVISYFGVPLELMATQEGIEFNEYIKLYEPFYGETTQDKIFFLEDRRY
ncbi:GNAT family N-acetyltransferase [Aerococcaceae bacterium WGS1372]